jgi:SAM-dependent methyltransferase
VICRICSGAVRLLASGYPGYMAPARFDIAECPQCACAFAVPARSDALLYERIYAQSAFIPGYERYRRYARDIRKAADPLAFLARREENYWAVARFVASLPTGAAVLDVGSGLGYLTYALARAGFAATGLDVSAEAAAQARQRFGGEYAAGSLFDWARERRAAFDAAIMLELIEHVEQPVEWIEAALELVRPGGAVLISTPNRDFYPPGTIWETDLPPVHIWWFSHRSIERLGDRAGAVHEFADFSQCGIPPLPVPNRVRQSAHVAVLDENGQPRQRRLRATLQRAGLLDAAMAAYRIKTRLRGFVDVARGRARIDPSQRQSLVAILRKR